MRTLVAEGRAVGIIVLLLSTGILCAGDEIPTLPVGAVAPDFTLPGVDGRTHSLREFAASKLLLIVFTCNHCPTAQAYEGRLKQLTAEYRGRVNVVAISPNSDKGLRLDELGYTDLGDSFEEMKIRARDRKFDYPYLYDGDKEAVSRAYGPRATPHAFLFDRQRRLRYEGRVDDNEREGLVKTRDLRDAIEALLSGSEVSVPKTKAFGCSIKWAGKEAAVQRFMEKLAAEPVPLEPVDAEGLKALRKNGSGNLRLISVWATWCGPCITEFPELIKIYRMYRLRNFELVTIAANYPDEKDEVLAVLRKQQASCRNLLYGEDDKYKLSEALDPDWSDALPYTLLLSSTGDVIYKKEGTIDPLELKRIIVRALKEDRLR